MLKMSGGKTPGYEPPSSYETSKEVINDFILFKEAK